MPRRRILIATRFSNCASARPNGCAFIHDSSVSQPPAATLPKISPRNSVPATSSTATIRRIASGSTSSMNDSSISARRSVFAGGTERAVCIARRESGLIPTAESPTGEYLGSAWGYYAQMLIRGLVSYPFVSGAAGNEILHRLRTALVGHVHPVDAVHLADHVARQMVGGADAGGAVGKLAGIAPRVLEQFTWECAAERVEAIHRSVVRG